MRVRLEDICEKGSSKLKQSDVIDQNGLYPVYGASGYLGNVNTYQQSNYYVAVVKDGAGIGRTMLLPPKSSIIGTMQYLIPKDNVLPEYLYYVVKAKHLEKYFSGATIPHIYFKDYKNEQFDLVSFEEQREIINRIKKIEIIIDDLSKTLALLDELVRARFVEMFGDPIQNSKGYPIRQFSDYIISLTSGSRGWAKYCVDDGKEWFITIKNVKDCNIITDNIQPINAPSNAEAKRTKVEEGDLLISITADLGRTGVVTKEVAEHGAYINQHLSCIRIDREILNPLYVAYYMESPAGKRQFMQKNQSAVKAGLNFNSINSLKLLVPPMEEQNKFIRIVKQIDKSRLLSNHSLSLIKSITF